MIPAESWSLQRTHTSRQRDLLLSTWPALDTVKGNRVNLLVGVAETFQQRGDDRNTGALAVSHGVHLQL